MKKEQGKMIDENSVTSSSISSPISKKKMKLESETNANLISKPSYSIKEKISYIFPSISVETISNVLDKAEQNINQGIQLLKQMNDNKLQEQNTTDSQISTSTVKRNNKKRNYTEVESYHNATDNNNLLNNIQTSVQESSSNHQILSMKNRSINAQPNHSVINDIPNNNTNTNDNDNELKIEAQKMVDEIGGITSRDDLREYLTSKFPSLANDTNNEAQIKASLNQVNSLQTQLKQIINLNQKLTNDIAVSYNQYDMLKKDNDTNIPILCNAISKLESKVEVMDNELEEIKFETTKYSELLKKENQSELVFSVESAREGF